MPLRSPCGGGGGALPPVCSASAEVWGATAPYAIGQLVRDRAAVTDPWVLYLATADHAAGGGAPSAGTTGYLPLTAAPTQIPAWKTGTDYPIAAPVRVDAAGGTTFYVATRAILASANTPGSAAGIADGWIASTAVAPPPAPPWAATATYRDGDLVQNPAGTVYVATAAIAPNAVGPGAAGAPAGWVPVVPRPAVQAPSLLAH